MYNAANITDYISLYGDNEGGSKTQILSLSSPRCTQRLRGGNFYL